MRKAVLFISVIILSLVAYSFFGAQQTNAINGKSLNAYIVQKWLSTGWNMGSQLDAVKNCYANEMDWRGYIAAKPYFDSLARAGIKTVRIPVTWLGHIGPAPEYKLDSVRMARVKQVVGFANESGLNVIINIHHDGSTTRDCRWIDINKAYDSDISNNEIISELTAVWTQIADEFKDYGHFLIFEPFNEIRYTKDNEYKAKDLRTFEIINGWNQAFVNAVRATGGMNADRYLSVVGYGPTIDMVTQYLIMPNDSVINRLLVSVHFYDPKDFTLNPIFNAWGHTRTLNLSKTSYSESYVDKQFDKLYKRFIKNGIPVYIGEMGCVYRDDAKGGKYRKYYLEYVCKAASDRGIACFIWDNAKPVPGNECHAYLRHDSGAYMFDGQEMVNTVVKATTDTSRTYTIESIYHSAP